MFDGRALIFDVDDHRDLRTALTFHRRDQALAQISSAELLESFTA
jgi:hypothetical protein